MEYKTINVNDLKFFNRRDIREDVVEKLKERIEKGFNPARPLSVVEKNGGYLVADGNHRLTVLRQLDIKDVPCVIRQGNEYSIALECNSDEETYAPEDLFDRLDTIKQLKEQGLTQAEIGEVLGVSRSGVNDYDRLLNSIDAQILILCKGIQKGRASKNVAIASFDFTEGWFRTSGLYDLNEYYQQRLMDAFINDKLNWNKQKVQQISAKYKEWMQWEARAENELYNKDYLPELIEMIRAGSFNNENQFSQKLKAINEKAKNILINGDAIIELEKLNDKSIDIVLTDPPYGINYTSNRSKHKEHVTKKEIQNDDSIEVFNKVIEILDKKTKEDSHVYIFASWKTYPEFKSIIEKYFIIKNVLIWDKKNHGSGDLDYAWGDQCEMIIFAIKGYKQLNKRRGNLLSYSKVNSQVAIHSTQKPVELLKEILSISALKKDVVCDPFMGSGSTIKAVMDLGDINYIGIEIDSDNYKKAESWIMEGR